MKRKLLALLLILALSVTLTAISVSAAVHYAWVYCPDCGEDHYLGASTFTPCNNGTHGGDYECPVWKTVITGITPCVYSGSDCTVNRTCSICGYVDSAKDDHNYGYVSDGELGHHKECQNQGCTATSAVTPHSGTDDGDCTTALVCECGYVITPAKAAHDWSNHDGKCATLGCTATCESQTDANHDHACDTCGKPLTTCANNLAPVNGQAATCKVDGWKDYYTCSICGKNYSDVNAEKEITDLAAWKSADGKLPAAHVGATHIAYEPIYDSATDRYDLDEHSVLTVCEGCGDPLSAKMGEHNWNDGKCEDCELVCTHSGGTATCKDKAVCEICGESYGERSAINHVGGTSDVFVGDETGHSHTICCATCHTGLKTEAEPHIWVDGKCKDCKYVCAHSGGTADCQHKAVCEICGEEYGNLNAANHTGKKVWTVQSETQHEQKWNCCGVTAVELEEHEWENGACTECGYVCAHSGGSANCQEKAVCEHCGESYGELDNTIHTGEPVVIKTATTHEQKWDCCGKIMVAETKHNWVKGVCRDCKYTCAHSGGTATCKEKAVCEICGESYGELSTINHVGGTTDRFTCSETGNEHVHAVLCATCGRPVSAEKEPHVWADGKCKLCDFTCDHSKNTNHATCGHAANCSVCGVELEEALLHWFSEWKPCSDGFHAAYCIRKGCDGTAGMPCEWFDLTFTTAEEEEMTVSICPVCGAVRHEDALFEAIKDATVKANEKWLPRGELIVRGMEAPYGECLFAFTVGYEYSGWLEEFLGEVTVTVPLEIEGDFRLVFVDMEEETEEQILTDVEFIYEDGTLTFETENQGIYLILPVSE